VTELYSDASQILGYDLLKLSLEGPKSVLDETKYCQVKVKLI
jgi:[acyl-carrier-protein] S-malonyltransferase